MDNYSAFSTLFKGSEAACTSDTIDCISIEIDDDFHIRLVHLHFAGMTKYDKFWYRTTAGPEDSLQHCYLDAIVIHIS